MEWDFRPEEGDFFIQNEFPLTLNGIEKLNTPVAIASTSSWNKNGKK